MGDGRAHAAAQPVFDDPQRNPGGTVGGRFPIYPGVSYNLTGVFNTRQFYDRGLLFNPRDESGILSEPPSPVGIYNVRLPQVDEDGNDIDGVRSPTLQVPLATYTSWNTRASGYSEGDACDLTGSTIPFPPTRAVRWPTATRASRWKSATVAMTAMSRRCRRLCTGSPAKAFCCPKTRLP